MSDVTTSVDVGVPVRTAYDQWTQFESFPQFMSGVVAVRRLDDRHTHWVTEVAGARREFDAETVEQVPDERISWRSVDGDVRHIGTVTFQPLDGGRTRVAVDLTWEPEGLVEKAGSAVGLDHLQVRADLDRFRRFIEGGGAEAGQPRGQVPQTASAEAGAGAGAGAGEEALAATKPLAGTVPPPAGAQSADEPGRSTADVVDILTAQHQQIKDLMARTAAAAGGDKQRLFGELVDLLKTHEKGEQSIVHPAMRSSVAGGDAQANARLGEEHRADQLIAEVQTMIDNSHDFDTWFEPWFEQLRQAVLDHAAHEEQEEFPKLRRDLPAARLRTMAEELVAIQTAHN